MFIEHGIDMAKFDFAGAMEGFLPWVKEQDPEKTYSYMSNERCPLALYFRSLGFDEVNVKPGVVMLGEHRFEYGPTRFARSDDILPTMHEYALLHAKNFGHLAELIEEVEHV
jgi:hypothetical protein